MKRIALLLTLLLLACSTQIPDFNIKDSDVDARLNALLKTPTDPNAVRYDSGNNTYVWTPEATKKAISAGVEADLYKEKTKELATFITENPPIKAADKARWFGFGTIFGIILTLVGAFAASGGF